MKKALAIATMPLATGGLLVGLMTAGPAVAGDMPISVSDPSASPSPLAEENASVGATTTTVPWCGWTVAGLPTGLTLVDEAAVLAEEESRYMGAEIALSGETNGISAFVSGTDEISADEENCSWYGDANKQGLAMTVSADRSNFTARAAGANSDDDGMGFELTESSNPLTITPSYTGCSAAFVTSDDLSVSTASLTSNPVTASDKELVTTTSSCTWGLAYSAKIPSGMMPMFGDRDYTFTGPTLTTTVNIN